MIGCPHCAAVNQATARFCDACGLAMERACESCNATNRPGARFCSQCGVGMAGPANTPAPTATSQIEADGERKHATVLFADVRGSTSLIAEVDAEMAIQLLDPALRIMQEAVERFGGVVNRHMGDGVMALFGAPVAAEDHALRACLAARAMVDAIAAMNDAAIAIRVGMASGEVVIRPTGRDATDYDAMGVAAHIAARLEGMAEPGTVLLPAATAQLVQGMTELEALGPQVLRGIDTPVPLFRLIAAAERSSWEIRSSAQSLSRFVGRESELTQLGLALRRARLRRGQAVSIVADAGVGKSRLVHEFFRTLSEDSWQVMRVAATPQSTAVPYFLAGELLRALCGANHSDPVASVAAQLSDVLLKRDPHADMVPLLSLLDATPEEAGWELMDQPARRRRLVAALRTAVLAAAAEGPLVLVVDDYHWVDQPSVAVLNAIVDSMGSARVLLLMTSRPDQRPVWPDAQGLGANCIEIDLQPLAPGNAEALLAELIGNSDALAPLRARIVAQADGTPLFLEEIASSLIESGVVRPGSEALPMFGEVSIPVSVQAILAARIDRLPAARRRLLQVASVIGKDLALPLLASISELGTTELAEELAALRAAGFLYESVQPGGIVHSFKHALTHAVAYDSLLRRHRRILHARVLAAMEQIFATRLAEMTEQLASHAMRGEAWPDAVRYCLAAAERANARSAWQEAVAFLESAVQALGHLPQGAEQVATGIAARLRLRAVLAPLADVPRMMRYLDEARGLADAAGKQMLLAQVNISRGAMLGHMGEIEDGIAAGRAALETMHQAGDSEGVVGASFALGQSLWYAGGYEEAEALMTANLPHLAREAKLQGNVTTGTASVIYLCCLSNVRVDTGNLAQARAALRQARAVAEATSRPFDLLATSLYEGPLHLVSGRATVAADILESALDIARGSDIPVHVPFIARSLGRAYALSGRLDEALVLLHDAMRYASDHGLEGMRLLCGPALGLAQALSGSNEAVETCKAIAAAARAQGMRPTAVQALHVQAIAHARRGDLATAEACFVEAIAAATALGMRPEAAQAQENLSRLLLDQGRDHEAGSHAQAAAASWRRMGVADLPRDRPAGLPQRMQL
jgi:class 3 adenylate cyclase/tetratricopeptide (TPR) repeat protein